METRKSNYETPQVEIVEIELEQAVLSFSGESGNESEM